MVSVICCVVHLIGHFGFFVGATTDYSFLGFRSVLPVPGSPFFILVPSDYAATFLRTYVELSVIFARF